MFNKILPKTGAEPGTPGNESNRSTNWATTTSLTVNVNLSFSWSLWVGKDSSAYTLSLSLSHFVLFTSFCLFFPCQIPYKFCEIVFLRTAIFKTVFAYHFGGRKGREADWWNYGIVALKIKWLDLGSTTFVLPTTSIASTESNEGSF